VKHREIVAGIEALNLPFPVGDSAVGRLASLADALERKAIPRGLLGARELERIVPRHVIECAAMAKWIDQAGSIVDVGSGAGLPGLVLACLGLGPITLVEAQARRAAFLRETIHDLSVEASVVQARAEDVARGPRREEFACAVARALARPATALELMLPLVAVGGAAMILIGHSDAKDSSSCDSGGNGSNEAAPETASGGAAATAAVTGAGRTSDVAAAAEMLGGGAPEPAQFAVPGVKESRWVVIVPKVRPTPDRYPRGAGSRKRRPLGSV
jgi:16S rRNA (guanine527-N7)-methyltransferase